MRWRLQLKLYELLNDTLHNEPSGLMMYCHPQHYRTKLLYVKQNRHNSVWNSIRHYCNNVNAHVIIPLNFLGTLNLLDTLNGTDFYKTKSL